jgi:hypothetical protein
MTYPDRVASRASELQLAKIVLGVIAAPFWLIGFVAGLLWLVLLWIIAAVQVGFTDSVRRRGTD